MFRLTWKLWKRRMITMKALNRLFDVNEDRFRSKDEVEAYAKSLKRKVGRYWNLAAFLVGFVVFALDVNSLAKTNPQIYMAFIEAALTGGIIGYIVKASERAFTAIVDRMTDNIKDGIKETKPVQMPEEKDWIKEVDDKISTRRT